MIMIIIMIIEHKMSDRREEKKKEKYSLFNWKQPHRLPTKYVRLPPLYRIRKYENWTRITRIFIRIIGERRWRNNITRAYSHYQRMSPNAFAVDIGSYHLKLHFRYLDKR